jgi:putative endonuclease
MHVQPSNRLHESSSTPRPVWRGVRVAWFVARTSVPSRAAPMRRPSAVGHTLRAMAKARRFVPAATWRDPRHLRGLRGERLAIGYLTACGWSVEAHRFRLGRHDLDLVVRRGCLVAFVEVKTRSSSVCGDGAASVTGAKCRVLARVAAAWKSRYGRRGDEYRFDVVTVRLGGGAPRLEHVHDAWRLTSSWLT